MSVLWILGEAKSGKSELAEAIFHHLPGRKFYIGTLPRTPENAETIGKHAEHRPKEWRLLEVTHHLSPATRVIRRHKRDDVPTVLLDGFTVYVSHRARQWEGKHPHLTIRDERPFVQAVCREYAALRRACGYLIIVDHISADPPTPLDYHRDPARWRLRQVVTRCLAHADSVIYHDRQQVTHRDRSFVRRAAASLLHEHTPSALPHPDDNSPSLV